jgi:hypothetical protein
MALRDPAVGGSKSEIKSAAKHVVIADGKPSDGGSIPPASTIFNTVKNLHFSQPFGLLACFIGSRYVSVISLLRTRTGVIISFKNSFFEPNTRDVSRCCNSLIKCP